MEEEEEEVDANRRLGRGSESADILGGGVPKMDDLLLGGGGEPKVDDLLLGGGENASGGGNVNCGI